MATNVTITTNSASTVSIKPPAKTVAFTAQPSSNISLGSLSNVDVVNVTNGQSLVYNSATGKFEANEVRASQPTTLVGGSF
jgi:hypothetical protein